MEIIVQQKKITVGDKYKIFIDEHQAYTACTELFQMLAVINLIKEPGSDVVLTINKKFAFFKASYDIIAGDRVLEFRTRSVWRKHFQCLVGGDQYDIYGHRGRKYSVYKNDRQVAWWNKNKVALFEGDNYQIIADRGGNFELVIAFCLIIDNQFNNHGGNNSITINFGHIGPQARKFDESWQPQH